MKIWSIAVAGICVAGLAACGSAASTSATAASHPAVASNPPASATTAPVSAPASGPPTITPTAPETPGTATAAVLWCGSVIGVRTASSLTVWETGSGGADDAYVDVLPELKTGAAVLLNPSTAAATVAAYSGSLCSEVLEAHEEPPPEALTDYNAALSDLLQATQVLHTGITAGNEPAALNAARPYLNTGLTELNAFLTAIGK
jgi:hypothetical protein